MFKFFSGTGGCCRLLLHPSTHMLGRLEISGRKASWPVVHVRVYTPMPRGCSCKVYTLSPLAAFARATPDPELSQHGGKDKDEYEEEEDALFRQRLVQARRRWMPCSGNALCRRGG